MKIKFIKSACGIGYGYLEGQELDCSEAFGTEMINLGYAEVLTSNGEALPENIPGREALIEAGFKSIDEVKSINDLTEIKGIGKATAEKIKEYLEDLD